MKNQSFLSGFLAASCLFLLISASTKENQSTDVPRYHLAWQSANAEVTVYDAVTGELEIIKYGRINDDSNLKDLLQNGGKR